MNFYSDERWPVALRSREAALPTTVRPSQVEASEEISTRSRLLFGPKPAYNAGQPVMQGNCTNRPARPV